MYSSHLSEHLSENLFSLMCETEKKVLSVEEGKCGIDPCAPGAPQGCLKFSSATQRGQHSVLSLGKNTLNIVLCERQRGRNRGGVNE